MGFEWDTYGAAWDVRLSELADYRKIHGQCNAPKNYSENTKVGYWVGTQRRHYRLQRDGKRSQMTLARIQALESLTFEWKSSNCRGKGTPNKPSLTITRRVFARGPRMHQSMGKQQDKLKKLSALEVFAAIKSTPFSNPKNPTGMAKSTSPTSRVQPKSFSRLEAGETRFYESDLDDSPSDIVAKASLFTDR
jgi:hypothetical protein